MAKGKNVEHILNNGDFVKHFKRELFDVPAESLQYVYLIFDMDAEDTTTGERKVVYRALYGDKKVYVRDYDEFMSETDTNKYPEAKQKFRFEKLTSAEEDLVVDSKLEALFGGTKSE